MFYLVAFHCSYSPTELELKEENCASGWGGWGCCWSFVRWFARLLFCLFVCRIVAVFVAQLLFLWWATMEMSEGRGIGITASQGILFSLEFWFFFCVCLIILLLLSLSWGECKIMDGNSRTEICEFSASLQFCANWMHKHWGVERNY